MFTVLAAMNKMLPVINNTFALIDRGRFTAGVGSSIQLSDKGLCLLMLALNLAVYLLGDPWREKCRARGKAFVSKSETEKHLLPVSS